VAVLVGVAEGGRGVGDGRGVAVAGRVGVSVGGRGVAEGGTGVVVGGGLTVAVSVSATRAVAVYCAALGEGVLVGGTGVSVGTGVGSAVLVTVGDVVGVFVTVSVGVDVGVRVGGPPTWGVERKVAVGIGVDAGDAQPVRRPASSNAARAGARREGPPGTGSV
jgi:hypothetical protein